MSDTSVARHLNDGALPWPPPGLQSLHGRIWPLARRLGLASTLVVVPLLWYGTAGAGGVDSNVLNVTAVIQLLMIFAGCALLFGAAMSTWGMGGDATSCVHRGYTWLTVLEVLADPDGRSGGLMSGAGGYGEIGEQVRSMLRRLRLVRAGVAFTAALLPIALVILLAWRASGAPAIHSAPLVVFGPSVALVLINAIIGRVERVALRGVQRERDRVLFQAGARSRIIEPWYAAFERVRGEKALGAGVRGGSLFGLALAAVVGVAMLGVAATVIPLIIVTASGSTFVTQVPLRTGTTNARIARAERVRAYAFAPDSTIDPVEAGKALLSLSPALTSRNMQRGPALHAAPRDHPPLPDPGELFGTDYRTHARLQEVILSLAATRLTPEQRAFLETLSTNTVWEDFRTVALAPRIYLADALLVLPLSAQVEPNYIPIGALSGSSQLTYANASRAAWHLANGRPREAERTLREGVSFGFRLLDNSYTEAAVITGATIVATARDALERLYLVTGDSARAREIASLRADDPRRRLRAMPPVADRALLLQQLVDPPTPQGLRWQLILHARSAMCGNAREILFGPSPQLTRALDSARTLLARTPAEQALFTVHSEALTRAALRRRRAPLATLSRLPAMVLGNPRVAECAAIW